MSVSTFPYSSLISGQPAAPPAPVRAFPGAEGWGSNSTVHGRNGKVLIVNTTSGLDSNDGDDRHGSLRWALKQTQPRMIVFTVSGTIDLGEAGNDYNAAILLGSNQSNVAVFGQTAPGDGICIKAPNAGAAIMIGAHTGADTCHDVLFMHVRFRHGCPVIGTAGAGDADNLVIHPNSYNILFDHCSFTWAADECVSFAGDNIYNVTFSRCIFAEGMVPYRVDLSGATGQNAGPYVFGDAPQKQITFHHNLIAHAGFRAPLVVTGVASGTDAGVEIINNVIYNQSVGNIGVAQYDPYTGNVGIRVDAINNYTVTGPNSTDESTPDPEFFTVYPWEGQNQTFWNSRPSDIYLSGNTWRNQDGTAHTGNDEVDNWNMVYVNTSNNTPTYTKRYSNFSSEPTYPVSTTSAAAAYTSIVTNQDVGATIPSQDSVDARISSDPDTNGGWSSTNIPAPQGTGSYPTLNSTTAPTDSSETNGMSTPNGLPDYYQNGVLNIDATNPYNPAATDTLGNGYTDLENWVHSIT